MGKGNGLRLKSLRIFPLLGQSYFPFFFPPGKQKKVFMIFAVFLFFKNFLLDKIYMSFSFFQCGFGMSSRELLNDLDNLSNFVNIRHLIMTSKVTLFIFPFSMESKVSRVWLIYT